MELTKSKATRQGAAKHYTTRRYYKCFPPYGKQLMQQRLAGQVPPNFVAVVFEWNLARFFPRVVIADDLSLDDLELRYLAGLDVMLAYRDKDAARVLELAQAILKVEPRILNAFAVDIPQNFILKSLAGEVLL